MSTAINPEAVQQFTTQAFEQSDRNPAVTGWGGIDAGGGQFLTPSPSKSRVTKPGPGVSPNAGLTDYNTGDSADAVQEEAEREG